MRLPPARTGAGSCLFFRFSQCFFRFRMSPFGSFAQLTHGKTAAESRREQDEPLKRSQNIFSSRLEFLLLKESVYQRDMQKNERNRPEKNKLPGRTAEPEPEKKNNPPLSPCPAVAGGIAFSRDFALPLFMRESPFHPAGVPVFRTGVFCRSGNSHGRFWGDRG